MGKTTIDFDDYDPPQYDEYDGDDPRPGWYTFELNKVGWYGDDQESLRWIFLMVDEPYVGWPGMVFANFDSTKWKNQEVARAIQGGAEKPLACDFDNEKQVAALIKKAARVRGKVQLNTNPNTGEQRMVLRKVRPLIEEVGAKGKKASAPADDLDDLDTDAAPGDEPYTEEELAEMDLKSLKAILKDEFDFSAADLRKLKKADDAIEAILEAQDDGDEDQDEDADEDFDDDFDEDGDDDEDTEPEPEPEPEPAPRRRRSATATKAAPAKKAAAPAQRTRRSRR